MTEPISAAQVLELARMFLGAYHRIRTILETTPHLDAAAIGGVLIRCRDQCRLVLGPPRFKTQPDTGTSKPGLNIWIDNQLRGIVGLINEIEEDPSFKADGRRAAATMELKKIMAETYAVDAMLARSTFAPAVAATVQ